MQAYKIVVAYDGTDYHGWQMQRHSVSVTQILQETFRHAFKKDATIVGASRTDTGVHAAGQVALIKTDMHIDPHAMKEAWNNVLPASIMIRSVEHADSSFHPQRNVQQKTYYYHVFLERPLPFLARYGWFFRHYIPIDKLHDCLQVFVGAHDFRSFVTLDDEKKDTVRTIDTISVEYFDRFKVLRIIVRGHSFLHYMIRRIVGAAVTVASRTDLEVEVLEQELAAKNPQQTLPKAPAQGLMLYKIKYKDG